MLRNGTRRSAIPKRCSALVAPASGGGNFQLTVGPAQVQFLSGVAADFLRQVLIGRSHVQKVPQWYGETIGFWNGTTLV